MRPANFFDFVSPHELSLAVQIEAQQVEEEGYVFDGLQVDAGALRDLPKTRLSKLFTQLLAAGASLRVYQRIAEPVHTL